MDCGIEKCFWRRICRFSFWLAGDLKLIEFYRIFNKFLKLSRFNLKLLLHNEEKFSPCHTVAIFLSPNKVTLCWLNSFRKTFSSRVFPSIVTSCCKAHIASAKEEASLMMIFLNKKRTTHTHTHSKLDSSLVQVLTIQPQNATPLPLWNFSNEAKLFPDREQQEKQWLGAVKRREKKVIVAWKTSSHGGGQTFPAQSHSFGQLFLDEDSGKRIAKELIYLWAIFTPLKLYDSWFEFGKWFEILSDG